MDASTVAAWIAPDLSPERVTRLEGGASPRTFWRARMPDGTTRVVMVMPDDPLRPDEAADRPADGELPWLAMQRALAARGVPVPEVFRASDDRRLLLVEDLGDVRLYDAVRDLAPAAREAAYGAPVALLGRFQAATADLTVPAIFGPAHMRAELEEFAAMGLEARLGITLDPLDRAVLDRAFEDLVARLDALPKVLAHRDFQSQNLMLTARGLVLVDFQDAFMAPAVYDAVALLRDSYVVLSAPECQRLLAATGLDPAAFHLQTIQRKLKDAGRFETLARKGKPHFLAFFADSIRYVKESLLTIGRYPELLALLARLLPEARSEAP